jgi:hypothetical protein
MANLEKIDYPDHLNTPDIPHSDLVRMTPEQQALAKDWNVMGRKIDWTMRKVVVIYNLQVDHDNLLNTVRNLKWVAGLAFGGGTVGGVVLYYVVQLLRN